MNSFINLRIGFKIILKLFLVSYFGPQESHNDLKKTLSGYILVLNKSTLPPSDVVPAQVSILVPTPLKVIYGDEVKIPIEVSGIPTPTISWDTPGGEVNKHFHLSTYLENFLSLNN